MWLSRTAVILVHAFTGWALCGATMGALMAATSQDNALLIHAMAVPVYFAVVSFVYFRRFGYTTPLQTAVIFVAVVMLLDTVVVAFAILHSFAMFASVLGTWIPLALIFAATYVTGLLCARPRPA